MKLQTRFIFPDDAIAVGTLTVDDEKSIDDEKVYEKAAEFLGQTPGTADVLIEPISASWPSHTLDKNGQPETSLKRALYLVDQEGIAKQLRYNFIASLILNSTYGFPSVLYGKVMVVWEEDE